MFNVNSVVDPTRSPKTEQLQRQKAENWTPFATLLPIFVASAEVPVHCHVTSDSSVPSHLPSASLLLPQSAGSHNPIKPNSLHFEFDFASAFIILNQMGTVD